MNATNQIRSKLKFNKKEMRLDAFINYALFSKNGYYKNKKPIGKNNDFITSPEISQMFGEILGLYLYYIWKTKINKRINLIELGPGNGTLFNDITNAISDNSYFFKKAKITFIEINKKLINIQKENLKTFKYNILWKNKINIKSKIPSIIYSNEFFDCFPVRQFILDKTWFERYVKYNKYKKNFSFINRPVKSKKLISFLEFYKKEGILEISFERNNYFEKICKLVRNRGGIFITIDYGYLKNIQNFTLQSVYNHKFSHVLENIGQQDISSHVNFSDLINIAKKNKLKIEECLTQREFLIKYGIIERSNFLSNNNNLNMNNELERLIGNNKMGNLFKCLVVSKL